MTVTRACVRACVCVSYKLTIYDMHTEIQSVFNIYYNYLLNTSTPEHTYIDRGQHSTEVMCGVQLMW